MRPTVETRLQSAHKWVTARAAPRMPALSGKKDCPVADFGSIRAEELALLPEKCNARAAYRYRLGIQSIYKSPITLAHLSSQVSVKNRSKRKNSCGHKINREGQVLIIFLSSQFPAKGLPALITMLSTNRPHLGNASWVRFL